MCYRRLISPHFYLIENAGVDNNDVAITRKITSDHPSRVSFPGLPSHAHSMKQQTIKVYEDEKKMIIKEKNDFMGIPYADYFSVFVQWYVFDVDNGDSSECDIKIMLGFKFHKSTWLKGTIESNTRAELKEVYEMWLEESMKCVCEMPANSILCDHRNSFFLSDSQMTQIDVENKDEVSRNGWE